MSLEPPAIAFRDEILATAARVSPSQPLRLLLHRKAPLVKYGEKLGALDVLLRLSFYGARRGRGVIVFEWPHAAAEHAVVQKLSGWRTECGGNGHGRRGSLEIESRPTESSDGVHLKVTFDLDGTFPGELLDLLEVAAKLKMLESLREAVARAPEVTEPASPAIAAPEPAPAPVAPKARPAAAVPAAETPTNGSVPAAEVAPSRPSGRNSAEQAKIDTIEHHAVYDPDVHPHVLPNTEVTNSTGETFRLLVKQKRGKPTRIWLRIGRSLAHQS